MSADRQTWVETFSACLLAMAQMYNRKWSPTPGDTPVWGFPFPVQKAYMDVCEGWSAWKVREVFRRAMQSERMCPVAAVIRAYGEGVRDQMAAPVVKTSKPPKYTPEEAEDIRTMIADLRNKGLAMPWCTPTPEGFSR